MVGASGRTHRRRLHVVPADALEAATELGAGCASGWRNPASTRRPGIAAFVNGVVLPHFDLFAPQVWFVETVIAVSLVFGVFGASEGLSAFSWG